MQLIVQAARARRRCDHRFAKGKNGPFDQDEFTDEEWEAIDSDEVLSVRTYRTDDEASSSQSQKRGKAKRGGPGNSAAQKRAEKKKQEELTKALADLPEGTDPTPESVKAVGGPDVTEAEIEASLKTNKA